MQKIPKIDGPTPFLGMMVQTQDGLIGEVVEISKEVKNLINKIKVINADGKVEVIEVVDVALDAIKIVKLAIEKNIFKKIGTFFKELFSKK